jgi:hypothetical protein
MNFQPIKFAAISALKKNLKPGLVLQTFAGLIVALYFFVPAAKPVFDLFADLKQQHGWMYSAISTSIFGGLIPFLYLYFSRSFKSDQPVKIIFVFYILFWAVKGVEVDYFYSLVYLWIENNFKWQATRRNMDQYFFTITLPANIVSNWLVWLPAVSFVYCMPSDLQIPLFNLVLCFWVLILAVLNRK